MLTINIAPELEIQLRNEAAELHLNPEDYLQNLIRQSLRPSTPKVVPQENDKEEFIHWWKKWSSKTEPSGVNPNLSFSREEIYEDDGRE